MLSKEDLAQRLRKLEAAVNAGRLCDAKGAPEVKRAALHWAAQTGDVTAIRRLAKIRVATGNPAEAASLLAKAHAIAPTDRLTAMRLARELDEKGQPQRALEALEPLLAKADADADALAFGARIAKKLGLMDKSLVFWRRAAQLDRKRLGPLIGFLVELRRAEEVLREIRQAQQLGLDNPELAFQCYVGLSMFLDDDDEVARARDEVFHAARGHPDGAIWKARVLQRAGRFDEALAEVTSATANVKPQLQATIAIAGGAWGRDASLLLRAKSYASTIPGLEERIDAADELLRTYGGSLEIAAENFHRFLRVRSPESVFEHVLNRRIQMAPCSGRPGLVMIAHSLAAGGAERILATCFRALKADARFAWVKLYLVDLSPETGRDFYLQIAGAAPDEIVLLDRKCIARPPLSWLPAGQASLAQAIYEQLLRDGPAIVHAWQEPLNVYAGLAATLAGVPQIVLHTHNMHPEELQPEKLFEAERLRECYQALLGHSHAKLICCAEASRRDYLKWLRLKDVSKVSVLHNGIAVSEVARSCTPRPCLSNENPAVIGTAIRFSKEKRPLRWIDCAHIVSSRFPSSRFVMFGDGNLKQAAESRIRSLGLQERFDLPGLVTDLYDRLGSLDLFLLSSRTEGLPNVVIEAQAAGVPIVAYNVGGIGEAMIDGSTGLLAREDTADALAYTVLKALSDEDWRRSACEAARAFVNEKFTVERMAKNLAQILLEAHPTPLN